MTAPAPPPTPVIVALAIAAHWLLWPYSGIDIGVFLLPWFRHIQETGPIEAFAEPFGNYAPPYLYLLAGSTLLDRWFDPVDLVKALSAAGSLALTGAVWHLLRTLNPARRHSRAALMTLVLPTTLLNAALMGQCDAMWAAGCVMAVAAALRHRHRAMLAWCGLAFAFKLQAIFLAPFILALLIHRRVSITLWPIAGAVWLASLLPAWLAGWPSADLLTIYLRQGDWSPDLALNAPNIWMVVDALPATATLPLGGLAFACAAGAAVAYVARVANLRLVDDRCLMEMALLAPLIVVGLLPRMHERYFFLADVLALVSALAWPDRRSIGIAALVQIGSLLAVLAYLSGISGLAMIGAVPMITATVRLARPLCRRPAKVPAPAARVAS